MKKLLSVFLLSFVLTLSACGSNKTKEYKADLQSAADEILENASEVEDMLMQYSKVWDHSIKSKGAITVGEMSALTGIDQDDIEESFVMNTAGNIPNDFSTNIHSLNAHYDSNGDNGKIKDASSGIKERVITLNKPPKGYEKSYDELLDLYDLTEKYVEMALNPSGSLQAFNENKNKLSSDILSKHKRIEVTMPSE